MAPNINDGSRDLTESNASRDKACEKHLPLQQEDGNGNVYERCPDLVYCLKVKDDALHVGTHEGETVDAAEVNGSRLDGLLVDEGYEATPQTDEESKRHVPV